MHHNNVVLLTESRYLARSGDDWYIQNVFEENGLITRALGKKGMNDLADKPGQSSF